MRGVALWFFASAVVYVTCGMVFGIWMSASHDHQLSGAHAHLNLVGWVTMALFGVFYHLVPSAAAGRLATLHFALATIGVWLMVPGIVLAIRGVTEIPVILGSFSTLASMLLFLYVVIRSSTAPAGAAMPAPAE
jgi:hypothetical protein